MTQAPDQYQGTSFLSVSRKKEALWNIVQPGDPYDIRKSMIAKVPFDKKTFMGDHLQLVCLFQAAQIQRLCEFLQDFKLRYRQIERRQLDRHSYEVQIKQLTHKLAEESIYRDENQKLREFIKNQSINKQGVQDSIKSKYEKLLLQAKSFEDENYKLKHENEALNYQISSFDARFQALKKSKQTEIDDLYMKMSQQSNIAQQLELSSFKSQYQSEVQRLDLENKRLKQISEEKVRQFENLTHQYQLLEQELLSKSPKGDSSKYEKKIFEYENRFVIFGQQIDRLNLVIKEISQKYQVAEQRVRQYEAKYDLANKELLMLQSKQLPSTQPNSDLLRRISQLEAQNQRLRQSGKLLPEFQVRLRQANDQIIRLNAKVKTYLENQNIFKSEIQRYQYESNRIRVLEKELSQYKQAAENSELKIKIAQDQNQVAILKQQLQRLHEELLKKTNLENNLRTLTAQNQSLQSKLSDWERRHQMSIQEYEMRMSQKVSQYQSRIQNINRTKGYEFESKASLLQNEVQNLNDQVRRKNDQIENYRKQIRELEYTITNKYELDTSRRVQNYQMALQNLKRQNQELIRRLRELEPLQRKINEYENRSSITAQEIDRLTQIIRAKDVDIENLKRQIRDQQITIVQRYQMDTSRKITNYESNLNNLNRQNQQFRRKSTQMENKIALLSQQIERLTNNLREFQQKNVLADQEIQRLQSYIRQSEINITKKYQFDINQKASNYETVIRNLQRQNDEMRKRLFELENISRRLPEYENQLKLAGQQIERFNVQLRSKHQETVHLQNNNRNLIREIEQLGRKHNQLQNQVKNKFQVEANRVISTLEQNIANFKRENDELKRLIQEYESRIKKQSVDMEALSLNFRNLAQQNEGIKRQLIQTQNSYRNKFQVEVNGKYRSYETSLAETRRDIENFLRQNNQLKRVIQLAEQDKLRLGQQNQEMRRRFQQDFGEVGKRLNEYESIISQLKGQNENLRRRTQQLQTTIRQKYEIQANQRISSLDQNLSNAVRENDELRRRFDLTSRELEEFRRITQTLQRDKEDLVRRLRQFGDINKKVVQYENKISFLAQESERTNLNLKAKVQDLNKADAFIRELTQRLQHSERSASQSQSSVQQFQIEVKNRISNYQQNIAVLSQENNDLKRRIPEYENKIVILNQQLQRINQNLKNQFDRSNQLENTLKNSSNENENLRKNLVNLQNSFTQKYEVQATRVIRTQEQNIEGLQRQNTQLKKVLGDYEQNLNSQNSDLQKLNANLKGLSQENNYLRNQIRQTQVSIVKKYESEFSTRQTVYEKDMTHFKRQNQQLVRKLRQFGERVAPEYENQISILEQQIQRLNQMSKNQSNQLSVNIKSLAQQNETLKRQIFDLQQTYNQKFEVEVTRKYASYEQNINALQSQNQQMKKYIQQLGGKFDGEMKSFGQNFALLQRQNEDLKRNLQEITFRYETQTKKGGSLQQNLTGLSRQYDELKRRFAERQQQIDQLIRKVNELQHENQEIKRQARQGSLQITQKLQSQSTQQITVYKQQITQIQSQLISVQRQNEDLRKKLGDFGGESNRVISRYEQDLRRINGEVQRLNTKIREYETKLRQISGQNETLRRQIKDSEVNISQKWQFELKSKAQSYEQAIIALKRQNQELEMNLKNATRAIQERQKNISDLSNRKIVELQSKVALMSQQIERLTQNLRSRSEQNQKMREEIQRITNSFRIKLQESRQMQVQMAKLRSATQTQFGQLQSNYTIITRQNQNYKKHLLEYENSIKKLYAQFERLQNIINDLKRQRQQLFEKNYALSTEIDRLLNENKDLETQVEDVRLRLTDESSLHKRINEHMGLMVILFAEIESLRRRVKDKQKQVQDVRRSSLAPFKLDKSRPKMESI